MSDEKPKDRDFVETVEGLLFCVVGYLHPPDRYTSYLKYIPDREGKWKRGGTRYKRALDFYQVSQVENTYDFLEAYYPHYLYRCPVRNINISAVPQDRVKTYYRPRERLRKLLDEGAEDLLEQKLLDLVDVLSDLAGLDRGVFGVTGSILTGSHNPSFSDIDLTVYGQATARTLKMALIEARETGGEIKPITSDETMAWSLSRSKRFPLTVEELNMFAGRRWNYGLYEGTYFSVHPTRVDEEIDERYGDRTYHQEGVLIGKTRIIDSSEAIFLPAVYRVDGSPATGCDEKIEQLVSFEGLFSDMFQEGELVEFRGTLERVTGDKNFQRVVIGGSGYGLGYIKPVN